MADADSITRLNAALEGRYRVERELGAGGMATVYLAEDVRHHRSVALKVLKPELAAVVGADRFLTEIETTAGLQHPHILPLFDSGEADGFLFYVMPRVEGDSLRTRLDREHQLPVDQAVEIASKVASALDYAHRHGVIHRDIKPANILLHDGEPVVADFGIALAVSAGGGDRLTETGLSLGTPHYMSPEQATGDLNVAPQTDIYALGCVLYEMLIGQPPYTGSTPQAVLGKIITAEAPKVSRERKSVPSNVEATIAKALEKVPADRFGDAASFAAALSSVHFTYAGAGLEPGRGLSRQWLAATLLLVGLVGAGAVLVSTRVSEPSNASSWTVIEAPLLARNQRAFSDFEFGPIGTGFVYGAGDGLWYRSWSDRTPTSLRLGRVGPRSVSPDGATLGVAGAGTSLTLVSLPSGRVRATLPRALGAPEWGEDGYVYFTGTDSSLYRVPESGNGEPESIGIERGEGEQHVGLRVLPGGSHAILEARDAEATWIEGVDLTSGQRTRLREGCWPRWLNTGHVVYATPESQLVVATVDDRASQLGTPVTIAEQISGDCNAGNFSVASDASVLGYWVGGTGGRELVWVDRAGAAVPVDPDWSFDPGSANVYWALSPDESRIAVTMLTAPGNQDVWVNDLLGGGLRRLTFWDGEDRNLSWVSDSVVTFLSSMAGTGERDVWRQRADGNGRPDLLYDHDGSVARAFVSPDGRWLIVRASGGGPSGRSLATRDIFALRLGIDSVARPLVASPEYTEHGPVLSPDGQWLAYGTNASGREEVLVRPFPDVDGAQHQVSVDGGISPVWSKDGSELFYVDPDRTVIAARIVYEPFFQVVRRDVLFTLGSEYEVATVIRFADVTADGRFLMMRASREDATVVLIHNFAAWLRENVRE